jgi:hypothetical protein
LGLIKTAYYPVTKPGNLHSPTVSRFGGSLCYLEDDIKDDHYFREAIVNVVQLYIPTLPEEIKNLFPESKRKCLFVFRHEAKYDSIEDSIIKLYYPEIFAKLKFKKHKRSYKPFLVTEWKQYESMIDLYELRKLSDKLEEEGKQPIYPKKLPGYDNDYFEHTLESAFAKSNSRPLQRRGQGPNSYLGGFPHFVQEPDNPKGFQILVNFGSGDDISSSVFGDCGTCQIWVRADGDDVKFKETISA